ncbi:MAG: nuclear transport factor 2 family protein [Myxococcota bacterium]
MSVAQDGNVAAELAIRSLVARYSDAVARRDEADWGATWAPDGEWQIMGTVQQGREDVVKFWVQLMGTVPFVVQVPSFGTVSIDGDRANGRWYVTEYGKTVDERPSLTLGVYHDQYKRLDAKWLFARRRFDILYMGPPDLTGMTLPFPEVSC